MIAVDWGTTNFRAYRLDVSGKVMERHFSATGLLRVPVGQFADVLRQEVGAWLTQGEDTVALCGMVGSRSGWVETGYVPCPASISDLADSLMAVPFEGARVSIVPGVECTTSAGVPEVMRGEESAIMGSIDLPEGRGMVCLPGTHSKWVTVADGKLQAFKTAMTGEVYAALRQHTILSQFMPSETICDMDAFLQGVQHSGQPGGLLHHLFRVRTLPLKDMLRKDSTAAFLSGLLIGSEVRAMLTGEVPVLLLGDDALCGLYASAIHDCGGTARYGGSDSAAAGLFRLATMKSDPGEQT